MQWRVVRGGAWVSNSEGVNKLIKLTSKKKNNKILIDISLVWVPGSAIDIEGVGELRGKRELEFKFVDSFDNKGSGVIRLTPKGVELTLKVDSIAESKPLRQYGTFYLTRVSEGVRP